MERGEDPGDSGFRELLAAATAGRDLGVDEAHRAFGAIMRGVVGQVPVAGLLGAIQAKGVAPTEVAGGVRALQEAMVAVPARDPEELVDTCGTGGGTVTTFNISTAAALVAAGAGVRVAKHGNRSFTSRSGSADVLEALGVRIELEPAELGEVLEEVGIVFMFAPLLHPAMRHVGPVRRELGVPTIMNLLGPLTNPAGARRQVVGVSDSALVPLLVEGLRELGHLRALVVHGSPGMDELSPSGGTDVAELAGGKVRRYTVTPGDLGLRPADPSELAGGTPEENAEVIRGVLDGSDRGGARTAVVLNAAAAIYVGGLVADLESGVARAREALDSGRALARLEALRSATAARGRSVTGERASR